MEAWWQRWRWTVLTATLVVVGFSGLLLNGRLWGLWGVLHMRPYYTDLVAILAAGEVHAAGGNVYQNNPLDPYGRPHVYGPAWLLTGDVGWRTTDAWWLGACLVLIFIGVAARLLAPERRGAVVRAVLLLLSPPVVLGLERGNNDLVILVLLAAAAALIAVRSRLAACAGVGIILFAAALKFYPLVCLVAVLARPEKLSQRAALIAGGLIAFAAFWWLMREDIARALALTPQPITVFAYGLPVTQVTWSYLPAERTWLLSGLLPVLLLGGVALWRQRAEVIALMPAEGWRAAFMLAGSAAWTVCFLLVPSFPYRMVLVLLILPAWLRPDAPRLGGRLLWVIIAICWLAAPKFWLATYTDAHPQESWATHVITFIAGLEQAAWLLVSVVVIVSTAAVLLRRWRADRQGVALTPTSPPSAR